MAKVNHYLTSFSGGELSPRLDGRVDVKKYSQGCRVLQNATVVPHGGARKRPGSQYVVEQQPGLGDVVLVPFQYDVEQAYCLIFGPEYIWFARDRAIITHWPVAITGITKAIPAVVTAPGHGFSNGDRVILQGIAGMTELNNRQFVVQSVTTNTFALVGGSSATFDAYTSGGTAAEIVSIGTTYTSSQLAELQFAQLNDTLYIAHKDHPLRKLTRSGHTAWTLSTPIIQTGPFRTINGNPFLILTPTSDTPVTAFGTYQTGTVFNLTATGGTPFVPAMVGGLIRLSEAGGIGATGVAGAALGDSTKSLNNNDIYTFDGKVYGVSNLTGTTTWEKFNRVPSHESGIVRVVGSVSGGGTYFDSFFLHPGYCVARITAYTSSTLVTCELIRYQMPASIITSGTSFWEEGAWSAHRGYPRAVAFYEQRLMLAGSRSEPTGIWGSRSGAYEDFEDGEDDNAAITYRVAAGTGDVFRWLSGGRVLTAGSSVAEFAVAASSQNEALTPSNFKAVPQTSYGTSNAPPLRVGQSILYPQRAGSVLNAARKLRDYTYDFAADSFSSEDLTIFSEHITGSGFDRIAHQLTPDSVIWLRRVDGVMAACTYERAQEIIAWSRHVLGGNDAEVRAMCVVPSADGDDLWISVERDILGIAVRQIEVISAAFPDTGAKEDCRNLDCHVPYSGPKTTTLSGAYNLRGQTVTVNNNGNRETATVDVNGRVTLQNPTTNACVGHSYKMILETEDLEAGAQVGTVQSRQKRVSQVFMRVLNSLGGTVGPDATNQTDLLYRTVDQPMGSSPPLYTGFVEVDFTGGWDRHCRIRVEHDEPWPMHITGIVAEMKTND